MCHAALVNTSQTSHMRLLKHLCVCLCCELQLKHHTRLSTAVHMEHALVQGKTPQEYEVKHLITILSQSIKYIKICKKIWNIMFTCANKALSNEICTTLNTFPADFQVQNYCLIFFIILERGFYTGGIWDFCFIDSEIKKIWKYCKHVFRHNRL